MEVSGQFYTPAVLNPGCWWVLSPTRKGTSYSDQTNFCKPLKKIFKRLSVQPLVHGSNDLRVGRKIATFQSLFKSGRTKDLALLYTWRKSTQHSGWLRGHFGQVVIDKISLPLPGIESQFVSHLSPSCGHCSNWAIPVLTSYIYTQYACMCVCVCVCVCVCCGRFW